MQFPQPFISRSDSQSPTIPVPSESKLPAGIQAAGHMMITYNNPIEWGTNEELLEQENAQRTTWAGKKELGWSGVEYFKILDSQNEEELARLMAVPGSWERTSDETLARFLPEETPQSQETESLQTTELLSNLAHGLQVHPHLSWEKAVSTRDPHRIIKTILYRSIILETRTLPSNAQLNVGSDAILQLLRDKIAEAKKSTPETETPLVLHPREEAQPAASQPATNPTTPEPTTPAEPSEPEEDATLTPAIKTQNMEGTDRRALLFEVAKRILPASRLLEARNQITTTAAEDAIQTAKQLMEHPEIQIHE